MRICAALLVLAVPAVTAQARSSVPCPEVAGHYRVSGTEAAAKDAYAVLRELAPHWSGNEVKLTGRAEDSLRLSWGGAGAPSSPVLLLQGTDFLCREGWLEFKRPARTSRRTDQGWLEGNAVARIAPDRKGGLLVEVVFNGSERTTLYSYDSARISIPRPGTGQRFADTLRWPNAAEPEAGASPPVAEAPREPEQTVRVRRLLGPEVLGNVIVGDFRLKGDLVVASLQALRVEDAIRFEDRLRAASIAYETVKQPVWVNRSYYLEFGFRPDAAPGVWRPSAFRVKHELSRAGNPFLYIDKVVDSGDGYLATVNIQGSETLDRIIAVLKARSVMFGEIAPVGEDSKTGQRIAQIRVRVR